MSTTKDKQIAQLSAQVAALTALVAQTIEQQQAPAAKGKAKKAAAAPRAGNSWSAFSGALSKRVTALIKEGYAEDERWESEKGAEDGCKRAGFQLRCAGLLKRTLDLDDGEGGYLEPEDEQIVDAIEHLLDNPFEQSATAEARGGMSVTALKAAGMKIAKPSAAKPVAKPSAAKPVAKPSPVKKAAPAPEPESEAEEEAEEEVVPAPAPAPAKKSPKAAPKSVVLAAAAEVAEEAKEAEEPTDDELKEAGLQKFKNPNANKDNIKMWYLRAVDEPKKCYLGGPKKEDIAKAWANFKAGICAGIWSKNDAGKLGVWPEESSA